jgi:exodeoxyribonuclease VIII
MITFETLQERPLSFSSIKEFAKSPRHYLDYITKPRIPPTDAMKLGSAVHCMLLRPEMFNDEFAVAPEINRRTNAGKEEWANFVSQNLSKTVIENDTYEHARRIVDNVLTSDDTRNLIQNCYDFEQEWHMDIDNLPYRGFFDGISQEYILEVKTIKDANPKNVMFEFYKSKYHLQAALYAMASGKDIYYIVIETSEPYLSYAAPTTIDYIQKGADEIGWLNDRFKACLLQDGFRGGYNYFKEITIDLPYNVEK